MDFLHTEFHGGPGEVVLVTLDCQANVMLLDEINFSGYRDGRSFNYLGGWATKSPVRLAPSHTGHWHVVVDLGGASETVRASIRIVRLQST